ncbi:MAG: cell division protein ZapA [Chitinophagales bacterium]|jgi:cell division protein ZapA (FtsZ GTPase activity inhibitor)|nr:cell division protein ZapA [Chitinophagales bacterium]
MSLEKISIEINIANRAYNIKVSQSDRATMANLVDKINEEIKGLQNKFQDIDYQDALAMILLKSLSLPQITKEQNALLWEKTFTDIEYALDA